MRHSNSYRKLGRESSHRRAMLRNMATSFLENGKLKTSLPKAKELRPVVEKLITLAKKGNLHARRRLEAYLYGEQAAARACKELAPRFASHPGGYTRIVKFGPRFGDGADMCQLELIDYHEHEGRVKKDQEAAKLAKAQEKASASETAAAPAP